MHLAIPTSPPEPIDRLPQGPVAHAQIIDPSFLQPPSHSPPTGSPSSLKHRQEHIDKQSTALPHG
eukprot:11630826-Alexandrium_andersonii.AAC.1